MTMNLRAKESAPRERRLSSITNYCGSLRNLHGHACQGTLDNKERCFSQASLCNAACALGTLSLIIDAAVVHHGPSGCAVTAMQVCNAKNQLAGKLHLDNSHSGYVCTDMNEADTVFGATDNLRDVIRETHRRYQPKAIFVGASCVSGVIGEDMESVATETQEELGIPVAPVHCEGFRTKVWASGFDAAFHAILTHVVKPPRTRTNVVNVINFFGSARREITGLFAKLGVVPQFLISNSSVDQLSRLSESAATVSTCGTLGTYLGNGLEQAYGVPYVKLLHPCGMVGFDSWLRGLGAVLGKEAEVEALLEEERSKYLPKIQQVTERLKGLRAVLAMGPGFNFNTARALQELGITIVHSSAWHFDKQYDDGAMPAPFQYLVDHSPNDFPLSVSDLQNYELINILRASKPDIFFSRHTGSTVWAMKLGIPALCVCDEYAIFGYRGLLSFAHSILDVVTNRSLTDTLAQRVRLPYTEWWLNQAKSPSEPVVRRHLEVA
ncbi:MAG: nitrogenase component 1 [Polyangiaceae bacterium]